MRKEDLCIEDLIKEESMDIFFQPIVSTYKGHCVGVEALVRGINPEDGSVIMPYDLFELAKAKGKVIELDRLCQRLAIEKYSKTFEECEEINLFLNVDNSVIHLDKKIGAINEYCQQYNVCQQKVVLEINELKSANIDAVVHFVKFYKEKGFLISIDDIGSGYSNLDRVVLLHPNIIKIDKELVKDIHNHYYKQQVVEMIIKLGEKTGALIVAEGVESLEETMVVLQYGAHLLQGYHISKPKDLIVEDIHEINNQVRVIAKEQRRFVAGFIEKDIWSNDEIRRTFENFRFRVEEEWIYDEEEMLNHLLPSFEDVECAYIISDTGTQITNTIFNGYRTTLSENSLFTPYGIGDDATLRSYYYILKQSSNRVFISDEYLSLATGNRCITVSGYCNVGNSQVILCLDMVKHKYAKSTLPENPLIDKW